METSNSPPLVFYSVVRETEHFGKQNRHFKPPETIRTLCVYLRTSSGAIYSRTVPPGDSHEYFDQIWFPPEPPGVAVLPPPLPRRRLALKPGRPQELSLG